MRRSRFAAAAFVLCLPVLASCSGGGSDDNQESVSGGVAPAPAAPDSSGDASGKSIDEPERDAGGGSGSAGRPVVQTRAVIATGTVDIVDKDLGAVRLNIDRLLGRYGGYVADEETQNDKNGVTQRSRLTVRVPYPAFDDVMNAFDDFTKVQSAHTKSEDVTTQVIDVDSRVKTQEASLRQLRGFLRRTTDIDTMVRLESEIAQREAALESMQAQASYLADQTSYATVTVDMSLAPKPAPHTKPKPDHDAGFLTGLDSGWHALLGVLLVAATVVGALLPFALVVALLGVPAWLLLRRRRRDAPLSPEPLP